MKVKDLRELIKDLDGDLDVIMSGSIEMGRGYSSGMCPTPSVNVYEVGEFERYIGEEYCDFKEEGWVFNEEEYCYVNTNRMLIVSGSMDEDCSE